MTKRKRGIHTVIVSDGTFDATTLAVLSVDEVLFSTNVAPPVAVLAAAVGCDPDSIEACEDEDEVALLCVHEVLDQWMRDRMEREGKDERAFIKELSDRLKRTLDKLDEDEED